MIGFLQLQNQDRNKLIHKLMYLYVRSPSIFIYNSSHKITGSDIWLKITHIIPTPLDQVSGPESR